MERKKEAFHWVSTPLPKRRFPFPPDVCHQNQPTFLSTITCSDFNMFGWCWTIWFLTLELFHEVVCFLSGKWLFIAYKTCADWIILLWRKIWEIRIHLMDVPAIHKICIFLVVTRYQNGMNFLSYSEVLIIKNIRASVHFDLIIILK